MEQRFNLNLVAVVVFANSLFMRAADPVIPQIAYDLNVVPTTAALLSTFFTLPYALVQPLLGPLADMFSKSRMMLVCLLIASVSAIVCGFAPNFEVLLASRVVAGIATGGVVPVAFALVGDRVPFANRQIAMGRVLFAVMTGNLMGATCSGVVGDLFGWRGAFFAAGGFGFIVFLLSVPGLRKGDEASGHFDIATVVPNYLAIFANPIAKYCFIAVFLEAVFMYGIFPHMATLLHEAGETRASIAGIVIAGFGIGGALYGLSVSRLLAYFKERHLMRLGGLTMGFCLIVIALRLSWPIEFINFVLFGFGFYLLHAVIQVYASELVPAARGSAIALHSFFFFLGQAAGPIFYGVSYAHGAVTPALIAGAAILACTGWVCSMKLRRAPAAQG